MKLSKQQADALARPFAPQEIEWRVGQAGTKQNGTPWIKVLAYLTSRAVQERLDEVFGVGGWSNSIREVQVGGVAGIVATLRVRLEDGSWVEHEDLSECSEIEPLKGAASGALKRVAVHFGIGRYLYYLDDGWAVLDERGRFKHKAKDGKEWRWNPPELPPWALPPKDSVPYNVYATLASDPEDHTPPPPAGDGEAKSTILGLVVPKGTPKEFLEGLEKFFDDPAKTAQKLRIQYAQVHKVAAGLGIELPATVDPKAFPVEIANSILQGKALIDAARKAQATA